MLGLRHAPSLQRMTEIETAVANYQKALEYDLSLARQETLLSKKRIASRRRLNGIVNLAESR